MSADEYYRRRLDTLNKEAVEKRAQKIDPRYVERMGFTSERAIAPLADEMTAADMATAGILASRGGDASFVTLADAPRRAKTTTTYA
jgi:hypothetical protein